MPDRKLFHEDASLAQARSRVVETGEDAGRPWVRLEETLFYPEGGGQPADRGTIDGIEVVDVQARGPHVLHLLARAGPPPGSEVELRLDAARRLDHRQQHTAQHLVTAIFADLHGRPTTSFHLAERWVDIEIPGEPPEDALLAAVEDEANRRVRECRAVHTRWVEPGALASLGVRTRGLPADHQGPVRIVEIEGTDRNTCGGTHVAHLGELQAVFLAGAERARGGARVWFVAGLRVLRELHAARQVEDALKARIGTAPAEFAQVLDGWAAQRRRLERELTTARADLARERATAIAAEPSMLLVRVIPDGTAETLRALATAVLALRPEATVALVGGGPGEACYLVQAGPAGPEDVAALGEALRAQLGAKGGGRGRTHQGRGGTVPPGLTAAALQAG